MPSKHVVNAGLGLNNIIPPEHIYKDLGDAFDRFIKILSHVLGPHAKYASLDRGAGENPIFTKDGIELMRSIECISTIDSIAASALKTIGADAERKTGDGTTSSMIIAAMAIKGIYQDIYDAEKPPTFEALTQAYDNLLGDLEHYYEQYVYRAITKSQRAGIAYAQTYTSSHGDHELAKIMAELCSTIPESVYEHLSLESSRIEEEWKYKFELSDSQYEMEAPEIFHPDMWNADLGTSFKVENATFICCTQVMDFDDALNEKFKELITTTLDNGTPLCVIMPNGITGSARFHWTQLCRKHQAAFFSVPRKDVGIRDSDILHLLMTRIPSTFDDNKFAVKEGVTIECQGASFKLNNIFDESDNEDPHYRKMYVDKDPVLMELYNNITEHLATANTGAYVNLNSNAEMKRLVQLRSRLILKARPILKIGGTNYDNHRLQHILADVLISCHRVLKHGVVLASNRTLVAALQEQIEVYNEKTEKWEKMLADNICKGVIRLNEILFKNAHLPINHDYHSVTDLITGKNYRFIDIDYMIKQVSENGNTQDPIPLQAANFDIDMLRKFGDVILKYAFSQMIVINNGVYNPYREEPEKKKWAFFKRKK